MKLCDYCNKPAELVDSSVVYGVSYGKIYLCSPCDAYVGVHKGTDVPLGRLANKELREWKKLAHYHFDASWKGVRPRKSAYRELAARMDLPEEKAHIGMFDVDLCRKVVELYRK
jgi:hypothetical protein